eukprot:TRINITY_DN12101_c0_g1_i27.p1 TRINITY_DN12101_c0_g1~~TRINITY_DN12101_c0_g1_i27.p1  ORF type:complete len:494 (+),score=52.47 TRINITY_DN12101_c0_g1_i27:238-1719(+)
MKGQNCPLHRCFAPKDGLASLRASQLGAGSYLNAIKPWPMLFVESALSMHTMGIGSPLSIQFQVAVMLQLYFKIKRETCSVLPILLAGKLKVTVVHTTRPGEAVTIAELSAQQYRDVTGIICCGGDGLISEVLWPKCIELGARLPCVKNYVQNGNWASRKLPIAVIPAGSDNSLAATLNLWDVYLATMALLKGKPVAMDAMTMHEAELISGTSYRVGRRIAYVHTCVGWGFIGDILEDIGKHRWMGKPKSVFCAVKKGVSFSVMTHEGACWMEDSIAMPKCNFQRCPRTNGFTCVVCAKAKQASTAVADNSVLDVATWTQLPVRDYAALNIGVHPAHSMSVAKEARMCPGTHIADNSLSVVAVNRVSWIRYVGVMTRIAADGETFVSLPGVEYNKASKLLLHRAESANNSAFGVDGEIVHPTTHAVLVQVLPGQSLVMQLSADQFHQVDGFKDPHRHCRQVQCSSTSSCSLEMQTSISVRSVTLKLYCLLPLS